MTQFDPGSTAQFFLQGAHLGLQGTAQRQAFQHQQWQEAQHEEAVAREQEQRRQEGEAYRTALLGYLQPATPVMQSQSVHEPSNYTLYSPGGERGDMQSREQDGPQSVQMPTGQMNDPDAQFRKMVTIAGPDELRVMSKFLPDQLKREKYRLALPELQKSVDAIVDPELRAMANLHLRAEDFDSIAHDLQLAAQQRAAAARVQAQNQGRLDLAHQKTVQAQALTPQIADALMRVHPEAREGVAQAVAFLRQNGIPIGVGDANLSGSKPRATVQIESPAGLNYVVPKGTGSNPDSATAMQLWNIAFFEADELKSDNKPAPQAQKNVYIIKRFKQMLLQAGWSNDWVDASQEAARNGGQASANAAGPANGQTQPSVQQLAEHAKSLGITNAKDFRKWATDNGFGNILPPLE